MHALLIAHCRQDIIVYPFNKRVDGNRTFNPSFIIKGYSEPKIRIVKDIRGQDTVSTTTLIIDGTEIDKLTVQDDVQMDLIQRRAIINIQAFPNAFTTGYDHLEVYV